MSPSVSAPGTRAPISGPVSGAQYSSPFDQNDYHDVNVFPRGNAETGQDHTDLAARTPVLSDVCPRIRIFSYLTSLEFVPNNPSVVRNSATQDELGRSRNGI